MELRNAKEANCNYLGVMLYKWRWPFATSLVGSMVGLSFLGDFGLVVLCLLSIALVIATILLFLAEGTIIPFRALFSLVATPDEVRRGKIDMANHPRVPRAKFRELKQTIRS